MITEIDGIEVGHWTHTRGRTGCTVVLLPPETEAAAEVRGGAPASRELDLLAPGRLVAHPDALVLTGGSAFGLAAADGVAAWLAERGRGFPTAHGPVPIVPALALYDLGVGDPTVRPGPAEGRAACDGARGGPMSLGPSGAGAGATVGKWRGPDHVHVGGLGGATVRSGDLLVSALVAVNAFGSIDRTGLLVDRAVELGWPPAGSGGPGASFGDEAGSAGGATGATGTNTTIGVIATNARLDRLGCLALAQGGHDGLARSIVPAHTRVDGDALFAVATGQVDADVDHARLLAVAAVERAVRSLA